MDARSAQAAQVWADRLAVLHGLLDRAGAALSSMDGSVATLVRGPLQREVDDARQAVRDLAGRVPGSSRPAGQAAAVALLVEELASECLDLAQGASARAQGVDADVCAVADRLVDEVKGSLALPQWPSWCVPGPVDGYGRRSKVVHVGLAARTGPEGLWSLPAVGHELGHQVAALVVREAGTVVLTEVLAVVRRAGRADAQLGAHVSELFADCFAAWVLGPAYGFWLAWLGLGPGDGTASATHPAAPDRCHQVSETLRRVGEVDAAVGAVLQVAAASWDMAPEARDAALDPWCEELRGLLEQRLLGARYRGWSTAVGRAPALVGDRPGRPPTGPVPVAEVLNAAWWARSKRPADAAGICQRAWALL